MKRKLLFSSTLASALLASSAMAQVVNFQDQWGGQPLHAPWCTCTTYSMLFCGQGAYSDPGNDIWNGYAVWNAHLIGSGYVFGGSWVRQPGNPGNNYAAYVVNDNWVSCDGNAFLPFPYATGSDNYTMYGNPDSSGNMSPVTLAFDNWDAGNSADYTGPGLGGVPNGTPEYLLGCCEYAQNYSNIPFTNSSELNLRPQVGIALGNVPGGTNKYGLYLYGANWNNSRGTTFSVNSGNAHNGINSTLNSARDWCPANAFVEGQTFVIFENVTPDINGIIHISATPNALDGVGNINLADEADVCAVQLIFNPPPTAVSPTAAQNVLAGGTATFTFTPAFVSGATTYRWQSVIGGVTTPLSDGGGISGSGTTTLVITGVAPANVGLYQCVITTGSGTGTSPLAPLTILSYTGGNILQKGDAVADFNNNKPTGSGCKTIPPPFGTSVTNVLDGDLIRYQNYGVNSPEADLAPFVGPVGFVVTPQIGASIVTGMRFFTAWDHPEDDPKDYLLEGSTDGGVTYTAISGSANLALPAQRNVAGGPINLNNQVMKEIDFANSTPYTTYRLTFTNVNNNATASNGMQIAEIQLLAPAPIITQQPSAAYNVLVGGSLNASVKVNGADTLTYQWYSNAVIMPGATTSTLTVANLAANSGGGPFTCVIQNSYGTVTSSPATLTMVTPTTYDAVVLADQPLAFYPLNEASGTTAYDVAGGYNGAYLNSPALNQTGPSSALPASAVFDGATQSVLIPEAPALDFGGPITLEAWIEPAGVQPASLNNIISKGYDPSLPFGPELCLRLDTGAQHVDADYYDYFQESGSTFAAPAAGIPTVSWTYVVATWDGTAWNIYLNGVLAQSSLGLGPRAWSDPWGIADGTTSPAWGMTSADTTPSGWGNARLFAGNICAAAIYNHALTPTQVAAHYGAGLQPPPMIAPPQDSVVIAGSNVTMSVTAGGAPPLSYQWYNGTPSAGTLLTGDTQSTLTFTAATSGQAGSYYVVVTDGNGLSTTNTQAALLNVITSPLPGTYFTSVVGLNPLAYWPLNENVQPTPAVAGGALNDGTLGAEAGSAIYNSAGVTYQDLGPLASGTPNYAIATDGASGYANLPFMTTLSNSPPFTVEAWLQSATPGSETCALACCDAGGPDGNRAGWLIYMDGQAAGEYNFRGYNKNLLNVSINFSASTAVLSNTWHHLVVVVNTNGNPVPNSDGVYPAGSVTATMYLDGALSATSPASGYAINNWGGFTIGARSDIGFLFNGQEAQVAYYTHALSATSIAAHYSAATNTAPPTPYNQVVMADNPMLYYQLTEASPSYPPANTEPVANNYGATGAMDNGNYLPGCFPAAVPGPNVAGFPATGANNLACSFDHNYWINPTITGGTGTGFVDVPMDSYNSLNVLGPVSMAAWVQYTPLQAVQNRGQAYECFAGRGDSHLRLQIADDIFGEYGNSSLVQFGDGGGYVNGIAPGGVLNDGNWHFVVGTWDGRIESMYIDGVLNATNGNTSLPSGNNNDFNIGASPDNEPNRVFDGNVAQVAVFGSALSAAQVQSLYNSAEVAPFITQQPPATLNVPAGANVTLSVTANGSPTLTYAWLKGGSPVSGAEYSGANTATLTITGAGTLDTGAYTVSVGNSYGNVKSSAASVIVGAGAPVIVTDISPLLTEAAPGDVLTFSVGATGSETLYYQWMQDGGAVLGATTSSYTFSALAGSHTYSVTVSNTVTSTPSSTATVLSYLGYPSATNPPPVVGFNGDGANWTLNQGYGWPGNQSNPKIVNNVLTLTDGINGETCSAFFNTPQYVGSFIAAFTFTAEIGTASPIADGSVFCIQNAPEGPEALGGGGGGLGFDGLDPSVGLLMNVYVNDHGGPGIQFANNGNIPDGNPGPTAFYFNSTNFVSVSPVSLTTGDPVNFVMYYNANVLQLWISDPTLGTHYSTSISVPNIPAIVGGGTESTGYIGFAAGTGALNYTQTISNFVFSYTTTMTPSLSVTHGAPGSVVLSWPVGVSPLFMLQQSTGVNGPWSNAGGTPAVVGGQNQVTLTPATTSTFFRLSLQP